MVAWGALCFVLCLLSDWLAVKHYYATSHGQAMHAALLSGTWTAVSAAGLVVAVKVSLWLLAVDVLGHAAGSFIAVRWHRS